MSPGTAIATIALFFSIASFVVTLLLTLRRDSGAIRPILVFTYREEGWNVENLGNGPALDVVFHRLSGRLSCASGSPYRPASIRPK